MSHPLYPLRFDHPNNVWWEVQIMMLLTVQFSPFTSSLLPSRSKYSPQHSFPPSWRRAQLKAQTQLYLYLYPLYLIAAYNCDSFQLPVTSKQPSLVSDKIIGHLSSASRLISRAAGFLTPSHGLPAAELHELSPEMSSLPSLRWTCRRVSENDSKQEIHLRGKMLKSLLFHITL
jgi:hypothetical protein